MPLYAPAPKCPVHGTQGRRVRNGIYRRPGQPVPRQRYRCWPDKPDPDFPKGFHNFTPPLAREHVHTGENHCEACEERRNVHHGDQVVARRQSWNLRVVAEGLEKLASGAETYSSVGRWAWETTGRVRTRPAKLSDAERERRAKVAAWEKEVRAAEAAGSRPPAKPRGLSLDPLPSALADRRRRRDADGRELPARRTPSARSAEARNRWHVAADWVEMYAPVLWQPLHGRLLAAEAAEHARRVAMTDAERAADGRPQVLLLDDSPVNSRAAFDGRATLRSRREYFVLGAATIDWPARRPGDGPPTPDDRHTRLRLLRAYPSNERTAWRLLFDELGFQPGVREPEFILADAGTGLRRGIEDYFQTAVLVPSLFHIHEALTEALVRQTPGAVVLTDTGKALRPELAAHLSWLTADRIRSMDDRQWSAWWDDFEVLLDRLNLPPEKLVERRASYEPSVAAALPSLRAHPGVPVSTGGFETLPRTTVKTVLTGRGHAFANIERTNNLFDLVVCRNRGVFAQRSDVLAKLRTETLRHDGWAAAPRDVADPQPPAPATYSSLRDKDLLDQLGSRGAA
ncbi:hypothetical protein [Modestobacter roseus]|uniref:hypothetical protein n=1 Tax=Modestobacter roseus TaxID=1181884 RepID=UPI001885C131|nr:hypothetical protein [Modestobacter roseus]